MTTRQRKPLFERLKTSLEEGIAQSECQFPIGDHMAGYYLYTINNDVFTQLTTAPTREEGEVLADSILGELEDLIGEEHEKPEASIWPLDREALVDLIVQRLALPDWYSDLSYDDAVIWDDIVWGLQDRPGKQFGIDFECSDYGSIYWDCAEIAARQGARMMAEPVFGNSGYRYFGKPSSRYTVYPMYSLFTPEKTNTLLAQLDHVEPYFANLPNDYEGSPREQFFEGLLPTVRNAAERGRVLWVQTDT